MDKKKKIVASAIFGIFVILIGIFAQSVLFGSESSNKALLINTPDVNEKELEDPSKVKSYDAEVELGAQSEAIIDREDKDSKRKNEGLPNFNPFARNAPENASAASNERGQNERGQQVDPELVALMQLQEQLMAEEARNSSRASYRVQGAQPSTGNPPEPEKELTLNEMWTKNEEHSTFFRGATQKGNKDDALNLTPCETVDQGTLIQGSTMAIRTKKAIHTGGLNIPKGTVLYGKVSFSGQDRLQVDIQSYIDDSKMNTVSLAVFDFDGREGIHLGVNSWPKIPSKVAKEVLNYVKTRGTQASTFGGDTGVDLGQAKDIAILSGLKEVSEELLEKRKVFVPKKYNLWININTQDNQEEPANPQNNTQANANPQQNQGWAVPQPQSNLPFVINPQNKQ